jgi:hypothetical protein
MSQAWVYYIARFENKLILSQHNSLDLIGQVKQMYFNYAVYKKIDIFYCIPSGWDDGI